MYYIFDGTYTGFLCCVFESFEYKDFSVVPQLEEDFQMDIFMESKFVISDVRKAQRVQDALIKRMGREVAMDFYRVFLSEDRQAWAIDLRLIQRLFKGQYNVLQNYGDQDVMYFTQVLKKVGRERHRMKAFVRFQKSDNGLYVSMIEPDFNVLPLIADFFKKRYADQSWLIYDVQRKYGLLYDRAIVTEVRLSAEEKDALATSNAVILDTDDANFQKLWKSYFTSTNIKERRNMRLHLQHVPKRYWKYLSEKW